MSNFASLGLNSWIVRQLESVNIKDPTDIQRNCIPEILRGKNCIGAAKTGSGKTMAFALPILQNLSEDPYGVFAVILTPTRELAYQISDAFAVIGKAIHLRQVVTVGGMDMVAQAADVARQPHIIVATPGRLADILDTSAEISLKRVKYLVLDEADRLLSSSFDDQLKTIFGRLPKSKQILLFSATITDALEKVKLVMKDDFFQWEQPMETATVEELEQYFVLCPGYVKDGYLAETVRKFREKHENASVIVFTNTCKNCQLLSDTFNDVGFDNVSLHGMISQRERLAALNKFKSNLNNILVATDVASRGLDIPEVELVINHNVPPVPKDYIHRVGRTARAGKRGVAITLVTPSDLPHLKDIEEAINTKLQPYPIDAKEVSKIFAQVSVAKRKADVNLDQNNEMYEKKEINKRKKLILEGKIDEDEGFTPLKSKKKKKKLKE